MACSINPIVLERFFVEGYLEFFENWYLCWLMKSVCLNESYHTLLTEAFLGKILGWNYLFYFIVHYFLLIKSNDTTDPHFSQKHLDRNEIVNFRMFNFPWLTIFIRLRQTENWVLCYLKLPDNIFIRNQKLTEVNKGVNFFKKSQISKQV